MYCISRPAAITAAWPPSGRSMPQCLMFQARCEFALPLCLKNNAAMGGFCSFLTTRPSRTSLKCSVVSALLARPLEPAGRLCHLHMSTREVGAHVHVSSCATLKLCPCVPVPAAVVQAFGSRSNTADTSGPPPLLPCHQPTSVPELQPPLQVVNLPPQVAQQSLHPSEEQQACRVGEKRARSCQIPSSTDQLPEIHAQKRQPQQSPSPPALA